MKSSIEILKDYSRYLTLQLEFQTLTSTTTTAVRLSLSYHIPRKVIAQALRFYYQRHIHRISKPLIFSPTIEIQMKQNIHLTAHQLTRCCSRISTYGALVLQWYLRSRSSGLKNTTHDASIFRTKSGEETISCAYHLIQHRVVPKAVNRVVTALQCQAAQVLQRLYRSHELEKHYRQSMDVDRIVTLSGF